MVRHVDILRVAANYTTCSGVSTFEGNKLRRDYECAKCSVKLGH